MNKCDILLLFNYSYLCDNYVAYIAVLWYCGS